MATLYISYFGDVADECASTPISSETVTTSTTSAASGAIPAGAKVAAIVSDTAHYVTINTGTPTAAITNSFYLPANTMRELRVNKEVTASKKIAAITLA